MTLQRSLCAWNTRIPRVVFDSRSEGSRGSLENGFANMVTVSSGQHFDMQIARNMSRKRMPEIDKQFRIEVTNLL